MYSKILKDTMKMDDISELCVGVDCRDVVFPLCFIRSENLKYLVLDSTAEDGTEKVVIVPKSNVLSVNVVYQQDIERMFEGDDEDEMFG